MDGVAVRFRILFQFVRDKRESLLLFVRDERNDLRRRFIEKLEDEFRRGVTLQPFVGVMAAFKKSRLIAVFEAGAGENFLDLLKVAAGNLPDVDQMVEGDVQRHEAAGLGKLDASGVTLLLALVVHLVDQVKELRDEVERQTRFGSGARDEVTQNVGGHDFQDFVDGNNITLAGAHVSQTFQSDPFVDDGEGLHAAVDLSYDLFAGVVAATLAAVVFAKRLDVDAQSRPSSRPVGAPGKLAVADDGNGAFLVAVRAVVGDLLSFRMPRHKFRGLHVAAEAAVRIEGAPVLADLFAGDSR